MKPNAKTIAPHAIFSKKGGWHPALLDGATVWYWPNITQPILSRAKSFASQCIADAWSAKDGQAIVDQWNIRQGPSMLRATLTVSYDVDTDGSFGFRSFDEAERHELDDWMTGVTLDDMLALKDDLNVIITMKVTEKAEA